MWAFVTLAVVVACVKATPVDIVSEGGKGPAYSVEGVQVNSGALSDQTLESVNAIKLLTNIQDPIDRDAELNATEIIARWNYPVETHVVTTEDGYILEMQRIPSGRKNAHLKTKRRPVYLQHGLFSSSFDFVNNLPNESLAFILADNGFDVWLGNVRGNTYGRRHVTLSPKDRRFWEFTFDEFIVHDVPAMLDHILAHTGEESISYIGHSQGTSVMFGLLASNPVYAKKIRSFAALAPVANVTHITTPIHYLARFGQRFDWVMEWLGWGELFPNSKLMKFLARTVCAEALSQELCIASVFVMNGYDPSQMNKTRIPVYISHTPAGTSVRNLIHFGQEILARQFQKYDFGPTGNMQRYGQPKPPVYDTSSIRNVPIGFFVSQNDWFADAQDVEAVRKTLSTLKTFYTVPDPKFTHLDFLIGVHANRMLYPAVLRFLNEY